MRRHEVADLPDLIAREDGVLWVDIPEGDPDAVPVLSGVAEVTASAAGAA